MAESAQIAKMSHKHEAILNYILINPTCKLGDVAAFFEVTQPWLSTIIWSHAFQNQLKLRHDELFDVAVVQELGDKLHAAAHMTLDQYMEKVPGLTADQLISSSDKILGRLGFGTQKSGSTTIYGDVVQNNAHVSAEVLAEARSRIGSHKPEVPVEVLTNGHDKVGQADSAPAVPNSAAAVGAEIEGVVVRIERESSAD